MCSFVSGGNVVAEVCIAFLLLMWLSAAKALKNGESFKVISALAITPLIILAVVFICGGFDCVL